MDSLFSVVAKKSKMDNQLDIKRFIFVLALKK